MIRKSDGRSDEPSGESSLEDSENQKDWAPPLSTVAFLAKSLSDENRLRVLICLRDGRLSVSALVETLQLSQPLISHHLKELKSEERI